MWIAEFPWLNSCFVLTVYVNKNVFIREASDCNQSISSDGSSFVDPEKGFYIKEWHGAGNAVCRPASRTVILLQDPGAVCWVWYMPAPEAAWKPAGSPQQPGQGHGV